MFSVQLLRGKKLSWLYPESYHQFFLGMIPDIVEKKFECKNSKCSIP